MSIDNLAELEQAAFAAGDRVRKEIEAMPIAIQDVSINTIPREDANGSNSLDREFVARLKNREHLDDNFLANV